MLLDNKVVVVSGVGPGLGREIAMAVAREGASVMLGARTEANLQAVAEEIDPSGTTVGYEITDISDAEQATRLANELGADKIRVNTVVPTWMWGPPVEAYVDMTASAQGVPPEEVIAGITANMPLGEIPTDGDVADAVVFFASDRARMVTAQTLMINAGEFPH